MSWSRRPNSASNDPDAQDNANPLADNIRLNRPRRSVGDDGATGEHTSSIYDQHTMVDSNFANRSHARRERQIGSPFQTQQISSWVGDPRNHSKLMMIAAAVVIFLLLIAAINVFNRLNRPAPLTNADDGTGLPGAAVEMTVGPTAGDITQEGGFQAVPAIPDTDPAQQPPHQSLHRRGKASL
jgi:hypothetical protein